MSVAKATNLKWDKPSDYWPAHYILHFRANNADWLDTGGTTVIDPVIDLDLDGDPETIEVAVPTVLDDKTTYYWKVIAVETRIPDSIEHEGADWSFTTEATSLGPKKIMVHYMPWYQSQPVSGFWGWHWHMNHFRPADDNCITLPISFRAIRLQ